MTSLTTAGMFAGIGGIECGLERAGHKTQLLCEIMPEAVAVLKRSFPDAEVLEDITELSGRRSAKLPPVDVVSAGFPCQDLSQAGRTAGIGGSQSSLVDSLFSLLSRRRTSPKWVLVENVPFMLQLDRGRAMYHVTKGFEDLGFRWAYRVIDTRSFGIPQRRRRVILVASRTEDPRSVLFGHEEREPEFEATPETPCGFYWTEGLRGLGWAINGVPTLKGGSSIGIPSPPAIWLADSGLAVTPTIEDAESLQGFSVGWTRSDETSKARGPRWKMIGNAVTTDLAEWIGRRFQDPVDPLPEIYLPFSGSGSWPDAAWGDGDGRVNVSRLSAFPVAKAYVGIREFLARRGPLEERPKLSAGATRGFLKRARRSSLRFADGFLDGLERHAERQELEEEKSKRAKKGGALVA